VAKPYVAPPEFVSYPNYLDLDDLVPGGSAQRQQAELLNTLIRASALADGYCRTPRGLDAHAASDTLPARLDPVTGQIAVRLRDRPVRQVTSVSVAPLGVPGVAPVSVAPSSVFFLDGMLRIPAANVIPGSRGRVVATVGYTAGWPVTALALGSAARAQSLTVADPTGIEPGMVLRIWDPGAEEYATTAASYTPGSPLLPLTAPLQSPHQAGAAIDSLPADVHEAITLWAMGLLARPVTGGDEDPFSDTAGDGPTTAGHDPRRHGAGLIRGAKEILGEGGYVRAAS
jgi:hypothetical protein